MNLYKCTWTEVRYGPARRGARQKIEQGSFTLLILASTDKKARSVAGRIYQINSKVTTIQVRSEADLGIEEKMYPVTMVEHEGDYLSGYFGKEKQIRKWRLSLMNPDGSKPHLIDVLRQQWAKSDQHRAELEETIQMKLPLGNPCKVAA